MHRKIKLAFQILLSIFPAFIKKPLYRLAFGAKIGKDVTIGFGAVLVFDELDLGDGCKISPLCLLRVKFLEIDKRTKIGLFSRMIVHTVKLGSSVTIGPQVSIIASDRDPRCVFIAGAETWIFEYCYINPVRPIRLGRNVGVGGGSYIFAHGLWLSKLQGYPVGFGEVNIENDVWLPWGCFVMPGVTIGQGAVVGARSLITKSVPSMALAGGSPAKVLRDRVAVCPSLEEQIAILIETTEEFCQVNGFRLAIETQENWSILNINGEPAVLLAETPEVRNVSNRFPHALHVVHIPLSQANLQDTPAYSLSTSQCSPRSSFSSLQANWLTHLRIIGARHYPKDEVDVESELSCKS